MKSRRFRYTSKERDAETGLQDHGARRYIAWLGRWDGADPAGFVDGPNLYVYVSGNPIMLVDPTGREEVEGAFGPSRRDTSGDRFSPPPDPYLESASYKRAMAQAIQPVSFGEAAGINYGVEVGLDAALDASPGAALLVDGVGAAAGFAGSLMPQWSLDAMSSVAIVAEDAGGLLVLGAGVRALRRRMLKRPSADQPDPPPLVPVVANGPAALLRDGTRVAPTGNAYGLKHGTDLHPDKVVELGGLPAKGTDLDLQRHVQELTDPGSPSTKSGFRGGTYEQGRPPIGNLPGQGALYWGDFVYVIDDVPVWDVKKVLGEPGDFVKINGSDKLGALPNELEVAFEARVPLNNIRGWYEVGETVTGKKKLGAFIDNPHYQSRRSGGGRVGS